MKTKEIEVRQRAEKGSIDHVAPLRMSEAMHKAVIKAAKKAGTSMAVWIRDAVQGRLDREAKTEAHQKARAESLKGLLP